MSEGRKKAPALINEAAVHDRNKEQLAKTNDLLRVGVIGIIQKEYGLVQDPTAEERLPILTSGRVEYIKSLDSHIEQAMGELYGRNDGLGAYVGVLVRVPAKNGAIIGVLLSARESSDAENVEKIKRERLELRVSILEQDHTFNFPDSPWENVIHVVSKNEVPSGLPEEMEPESDEPITLSQAKKLTELLDFVVAGLYNGTLAAISLNSNVTSGGSVKA
jgi:hypothetical protein